MPPIFFELILDFLGTNFNFKHYSRSAVNICAILDKYRECYALLVQRRLARY